MTSPMSSGFLQGGGIFGSYPMPVDMMLMPGSGWDPAAAFNPMLIGGMGGFPPGMDMMHSGMMQPSYAMPTPAAAPLGGFVRFQFSQ